MTAQSGGGHTTVPQQAAAAWPWVACLAAACTQGQGTPCPWLAASPGLARSTAPLPLAQPWCACCAWLAGECWAQALRLRPVLLPGCCGGPAGGHYRAPHQAPHWLATLLAPGWAHQAGFHLPCWGPPACGSCGTECVQLHLTGLLAIHC
ncbi:hypothetical protein HaLaN_13099 [Haematococcus lacustris]|uniref:Uncharacterized protein n=1 Tax=Haematococcus lacustris TaxID=44745 RepID=A0A699Z3K9_HAELA|nr:hypothetical protein HaLaN_13099 [Haematococcus lacustris]